MATFRLNIARVRGCPAPQKLTELLSEFGLPDTEAFGVLDHSARGEVISATIIRKTQHAVQQLDTEAKVITDVPVERVTAYPFCIRPDMEILEIYTGSASGIGQVSEFLASCLALPVVVEEVQLDIPSAIDRLLHQTKRFELRGIRVNDYAHNSFTSGAYAPKFLDTQHGKDFLEEYAETITSASVRFAGQAGRISATLKPKACFAYSCNEDDQPLAQATLRQLL